MQQSCNYLSGSSATVNNYHGHNRPTQSHNYTSENYKSNSSRSLGPGVNEPEPKRQRFENPIRCPNNSNQQYDNSNRVS